MKKENLKQAALIHASIENCEDFISQCDYAIRNTSDSSIPSIDRFLTLAVNEGIVSAKDIKHLVTDLRDIVTTRLADLDKKLEHL